MALIDKYEYQVKDASLQLLIAGFSKLVDGEIHLEEQLKEIREAKARFMVEIDLRLNKK